MKKALPAIIPILFLLFLIPTTTVSANDGSGKAVAPSHNFGFPNQKIVTQPYHSFAANRNWWERLMDRFDGNSQHDGSAGSASSPGSPGAPGSSGSQGPSPAGPGSGPGSGAPSAPLDGGISLLLAAGIGLGVKKARGLYKNIHPQTRNAG